jgi:glycosyltransferase involved in cell wall biosynthesis
MTESRGPLVSVLVLAYNHGKYVSRALDGIVMQVTSFDYEVVVGEDSSSDDTRRILLSYAERQPDRFNLILQARNVGAWQNFLDCLYACRGKYIAICEGDDYWIDPGKLQKQVDFLESNPDYGLVFTDADVYYEGMDAFVHSYDKNTGRKVPQGDVFSYMLHGHNPYRSLTALFRNNLTAEYKEIARRRVFTIGDFPLWLTIAAQSLIGYLPDSTAVYRVRSQSASHCGTAEQQIRFRKEGYKICVFLAQHFRKKIDVGELRQIYQRDQIGICARRRNWTWLVHYSGCVPNALVAMARLYLGDFRFSMKLRRAM